MPQKKVKSSRKLIAIREDLHRLLKARAVASGMKLEAVASEALEAGIRQKRWQASEAA